MANGIPVPTEDVKIDAQSYLYIYIKSVTPKTTTCYSIVIRSAVMYTERWIRRTVIDKITTLDWWTDPVELWYKDYTVSHAQGENLHNNIVSIHQTLKDDVMGYAKSVAIQTTHGQGAINYMTNNTPYTVPAGWSPSG